MICAFFAHRYNRVRSDVISVSPLYRKPPPITVNFVFLDNNYLVLLTSRVPTALDRCDDLSIRRIGHRHGCMPHTCQVGDRVRSVRGYSLVAGGLTRLVKARPHGTASEKVGDVHQPRLRDLQSVMSYEPRIRDDVIALSCAALALLLCAGPAFGKPTFGPRRFDTMPFEVLSARAHGDLDRNFYARGLKGANSYPDMQSYRFGMGLPTGMSVTTLGCFDGVSPYWSMAEVKLAKRFRFPSVYADRPNSRATSSTVPRSRISSYASYRST